VEAHVRLLELDGTEEQWFLVLLNVLGVNVELLFVVSRCLQLSRIRRHDLAQLSEDGSEF
jgi:hypothetical protein